MSERTVVSAREGQIDKLGRHHSIGNTVAYDQCDDREMEEAEQGN